MSVVQIKDVTKQFGEVTALQGIDLEMALALLFLQVMAASANFLDGDELIARCTSARDSADISMPSGSSTPTSCSHTPSAPSANWKARSSMARKPSWSSNGSRSAIGTAAPRWYTRKRHWVGPASVKCIIAVATDGVSAPAAASRSMIGRSMAALFGQFNSS